MGRRSKKDVPRTFGVRNRGDSPTVPADVEGVPRTFGVKQVIPRGTVAGVSGDLESCPLNCPGEWIAGMWIHSRECPWAAVLWRGHGYGEKDWQCPYECPALELPSGWTHQPECPFWDRTGRTPFDHNPPKGSTTRRVRSRSNTAATVRAMHGEPDAQRVAELDRKWSGRKPHVSDLPDSILDTDDGLSF